MLQLDENTLMMLMMLAWLGEAVTLLPLSRCRNAVSALLCLLFIALGQLLCSTTLYAYEEWQIEFTGAAVLAGLLQSLSWIVLLPAVLLCGFASSITLTSLLSVPVWWLVVWVCGAQRWLSCDSWETISLHNLVLGLLLCAIGCALAAVLVGWRVKARCEEAVASPHSASTVIAAAPSPPSAVVSSIRSYNRAPPARLRVHRYPISLDPATASPTLSDVSPTSSPTGRDSPASSIDTLSASYSSALDFLRTEWQSSPSQWPFSHLADDFDDSDTAASQRRYYDAIALETEDSDDEQKEDMRSRTISELSVISVMSSKQTDSQSKQQLQAHVEAAATLPPPQLLSLFHAPTTPFARIAATSLSCLSSAVFQSSCLLPIYANSQYGLERQLAMGPYMVGMSATAAVCLIFTYCAYNVVRAAHSRSLADVAGDSAPPAGLLHRSPSATPLLPVATTKGAVPTINIAAILFSLLTFPLPFFLPGLLCLLAGAASALSFAFFHHLLQLPDVFANFGWYSTGFLNDHYNHLTALVPPAIAATLATLTARLLDGPPSRGTGGVSVGRVVAVWWMAMLLGSLGNFWIISNGLVRV